MDDCARCNGLLLDQGTYFICSVCGQIYMKQKEEKRDATEAGKQSENGE